MGRGAFNWDFNTNLAPQFRAFSRALKIEKLKASLFPGLKGRGIQVTGALYYTIIDFNEVDIRIYLPEKVIIHRGR